MSDARLIPGRGFDPGQPHAVLGTSLAGPYPPGTEAVCLGMGCFWGAERLFWNLGEGVHATAVGYAGGARPDPGYEAVCTGATGHAEVVLLAWDPARLGLHRILRAFWEGHDPTQGMRQGNDIGPQYRSCIFCGTPAQLRAAEASRAAYQGALQAAPGNRAMGSEITTEVAMLQDFYFAEDYHQQYLHKVPHGYCGLAGTGVACPAFEGPESALSAAGAA